MLDPSHFDLRVQYGFPGPSEILVPYVSVPLDENNLFGFLFFLLRLFLAIAYFFYFSAFSFAVSVLFLF